MTSDFVHDDYQRVVEALHQWQARVAAEAPERLAQWWAEHRQRQQDIEDRPYTDDQGVIHLKGERSPDHSVPPPAED